MDVRVVKEIALRAIGESLVGSIPTPRTLRAYRLVVRTSDFELANETFAR